MTLMLISVILHTTFLQRSTETHFVDFLTAILIIPTEIQIQSNTNVPRFCIPVFWMYPHVVFGLLSRRGFLKCISLYHF